MYGAASCAARQCASQSISCLVRGSQGWGAAVRSAQPSLGDGAACCYRSVRGAGIRRATRGALRQLGSRGIRCSDAFARPADPSRCAPLLDRPPCLPCPALLGMGLGNAECEYRGAGSEASLAGRTGQVRGDWDGSAVLDEGGHRQSQPARAQPAQATSVARRQHARPAHLGPMHRRALRELAALFPCLDRKAVRRPVTLARRRRDPSGLLRWSFHRASRSPDPRRRACSRGELPSGAAPPSPALMGLVGCAAALARACRRSVGRKQKPVAPP